MFYLGEFSFFDIVLYSPMFPNPLTKTHDLIDYILLELMLPIIFINTVIVSLATIHSFFPQEIKNPKLLKISKWLENFTFVLTPDHQELTLGRKLYPILIKTTQWGSVMIISFLSKDSWTKTNDLNRKYIAVCILFNLIVLLTFMNCKPHTYGYNMFSSMYMVTLFTSMMYLLKYTPEFDIDSQLKIDEAGTDILLFLSGM